MYLPYSFFRHPITTRKDNLIHAAGRSKTYGQPTGKRTNKTQLRMAQCAGALSDLEYPQRSICQVGTFSMILAQGNS